MTDTIGPFDSSLWSQDAWYRHAPKWAPSGVNGTPAASTTTGDLPLSLSGLNFTVGIGRASVRGGGFERSGSPASQAIAANTNASLFRRDRVVLRRDLAAKTLAPVLIQGTPSASPTAPAIQQVETGQWDEPLYSFLVPPNSGTSITGIVDERLFVDQDGGGLSVYSLANLLSLTSAMAPSVGRRVYEQLTGRHLYWDGAQWVKCAGPREVALSNGNTGTSGLIGPGTAATTVTGGNFTMPIAADTVHVHAVLGYKASTSTIGTFVLTVGGVSFTQTVDTGGNSSPIAVPVPIELPLSLAAGSIAWSFAISNAAGGNANMQYGAIRVTF